MTTCVARGAASRATVVRASWALARTQRAYGAHLARGSLRHGRTWDRTPPRRREPRETRAPAARCGVSHCGGCASGTLVTQRGAAGCRAARAARAPPRLPVRDASPAPRVQLRRRLSQRHRASLTRSPLAARRSPAQYIGGKWTPAVSGQYFDVTTPTTGRKFTSVARGDAADIELALDAAHAAAEAWGRTAPSARAAVLQKIATVIRDNLEVLAYIEVIDNGKPIRETLNADIPLAADHFDYFAGCLRAQEGAITELDENTMAFHVPEPLGVVGQARGDACVRVGAGRACLRARLRGCRADHTMELPPIGLARAAAALLAAYGADSLALFIPLPQMAGAYRRSACSRAAETLTCAIHPLPQVGSWRPRWLRATRWCSSPRRRRPPASACCWSL
jgi:hypothetical protein